MKRTKYLAIQAITICIVTISLCACGGSNKEKDNSVKNDSIEADSSLNTVPNWEERDSTIYGRADGFGMSSFTLIGKDGTEYDIALTDDESGNHYGTIYGDREEGADYAMTTRDDDENLSVLINLSQLKRFPIHYKIYNCHVILISEDGQDIVDIEKLDDNEFVAKGKSGRVYRFKAKDK